MKPSYIFTSERLGFRNWEETDIPFLASINSDPKVMEFFPSIQNLQQSEAFVERMQNQFIKNGFCYFAVDELSTHKFIGFIGISEQNFESDFTPAIDIGWRLAQNAWGKGYATEGAKKCIEFAFTDIGLNKLISICPVINRKSEMVMTKLNMVKLAVFNHPLLKEFPHLENCVAYEINRN